MKVFQFTKKEKTGIVKRFTMILKFEILVHYSDNTK